LFKRVEKPVNGDSATRPQVAAVALLVASLIFCPSFLARAQSKADEAAPSFSLKDLNGKSVRLEQYLGKVVLLNFWATWCPPCRAEMPELVRLQEEHRDRGLQIIGVAYPGKRRAVVTKVVKRLNLNYPILFGTKSMVGRYDVLEILPVTVIIDRKGRVHGRILGMLERDEFDSKVKPLLE
jgi:thiol-disulfide isomerase/thioredoxin